MPTTPSDPISRAGTLALWSFALVLVLLPVGRSAELPLLFAAVLGLVLLWRTKRGPRVSVGAASAAIRVPPETSASSVALRLVVALFLAYWLPMLFSAPDAVAPQKAWLEVAGDLRFAPFALLGVLALGADAPRLNSLHRIAALVVALWTLDALAQAVTGWSLGGRLEGDRVSGVFGDGNQKLGPILAVLSPFALEAVRVRFGSARFGHALFALAWTAMGAAILLAGARAGWIAYALVSVVYAWRISRGPRGFALMVLALIAAGATLAASAYVVSERFAARVDRTFMLGDGSESAVDHALAGRVPIFRTAVAMFAAHPVNGVGVRGFRHAYPAYAAPDDPWVDAARAQGALHPHHIVLEVLAETGTVGLACWLAGAWFAIRAYLAVPRSNRRLAFTPMLALAAMTFPLNTHFAFYSSYWGVLFWWLIALLCAGVRADLELKPRA